MTPTSEPLSLAISKPWIVQNGCYFQTLNLINDDPKYNVINLVMSYVAQVTLKPRSTQALGSICRHIFSVVRNAKRPGLTLMYVFFRLCLS